MHDSPRSGYLEVAKSNEHSLDNIDSNPIMRVKKQELMNFLGRYDEKEWMPSFILSNEIKEV